MTELMVNLKDKGPLKPRGSCICALPDGVEWTPAEMTDWIDNGVEPASLTGLHNESRWRALMAEYRALARGNYDPWLSSRGARLRAYMEESLPEKLAQVKKSLAFWKENGRDSNWGEGDRTMTALVAKVDDMTPAEISELMENEVDAQGETTARKRVLDVDAMFTAEEQAAGASRGTKTSVARASSRGAVGALKRANPHAAPPEPPEPPPIP